jgi:hypothetical protein
MIKPGNAELIRLAPVNDAAFRPGHAGRFEYSYHLPHRQRVIFFAFCTLRNIPQGFRRLRKASEGSPRSAQYMRTRKKQCPISYQLSVISYQ